MKTTRWLWAIGLWALFVLPQAKAHNMEGSRILRWVPLREPGSGGWVTSFRVSPHDGRRMVTGGDMLGAGLSLDGGRTWGPAFGFASWEINDATFHPKDPNIVWYGTLSGPYKSVDGGQHYEEKRNGFIAPTNFGYSAPVERILFDPNDSNHLICFGGSSRGWDLPGQKPLWGAVWESKDGGEKWTKIATIGAEGNTSDAAQGVNIYSAEFAAGSSKILYAVSPGAGFFVSQDGGKTWLKSVTGLPHAKIMRVQVHPKDVKTLWVSLGAFKPQGEGKALPGGIFKSTDGGAHWTALNNGLAQGSDANENLTSNYYAFAVSPKNPDVMYCADGAWNGGIIYVSRDGGQNWRAAATKKNIGHEQDNLVKQISQVETAMPAGLAGTVFSIDPNNPDVAFCTGSEHFIGTTDGGQTWRDMGNDKQADGGWRGRGFTGWCSMNARFNPWKRDQIVLNGLDAARVLITDNGGESWQRPLTDPTPWGGGVDTCFTPAGWIFVTTGQHGSFQGIGRSKDGGKTWQTLQGAGNGLPEAGWDKGQNESQGIYALPNTPKVWAGIGGKLYASSDSGDHWQTVNLGSGVRWIAADPKTPTRFFVSGDKNVYLTSDGGQSWMPIGGPRKAGRMTVDTLGRLYICADEGERGGLWRWDEKLPDDKKWTRLWDDPWIMNVAVDPHEPKRIAFTTNQNPYVEISNASGVWLSDDGGKTFRAANDGLPMLRGHAIAFDPFEAGELIYGSFGRGFFETFWPLTIKLKPGRSYVATSADADFAKVAPIATEAPKTPAVTTVAPVKPGGRNILRNGDMAQGGVLPTNWTEKWGDVIASRDTKVFKEGPASLRVNVENGSGQAFQLVQGYAGKTLLLSGFIKAAGNVKAQIAVQSFGDEPNGGWQQKKFDQVIFVQGDIEWLEFGKLVQIPEGTMRFNVQLLAEGNGQAWLDEVKLTAPNDTAPPETVVVSQPDAGPAPKDKSNVPAWGYYANFPLAWAEFHKNFLARTEQGAAKNDISVVFLGDSITQGWNDTGKAVWDKFYAPLGAVNYGIGGDSTRQVLWRLQNGEVDGLKPKLVVLKIGTNNLYNDINAGSDEEIAAGIGAIVGLLRQKLPTTKILMLGVLPRQNDYFTGRTMHINKLIAPLADDNSIRFLDMTDKFQSEPGKVKTELYNRDQLHLSTQGYELWAATMKPLFDGMMKD